MEDNNYYKEIIVNYSLIIIICLFLVVYLVINYSVIQEGNIYGGNIPKTIIITGIIFLIIYIFFTWEDDDDIEEIAVIPKYKIINVKDNVPDKTFKIENKHNAKYTESNLKENSITKNINGAQKDLNNIQENSNIFVPQKNKAKFGIKF